MAMRAAARKRRSRFTPTAITGSDMTLADGVANVRTAIFTFTCPQNTRYIARADKRTDFIYIDSQDAVPNLITDGTWEIIKSNADGSDTRRLIKTSVRRFGTSYPDDDQRKVKWGMAWRLRPGQKLIGYFTSATALIAANSTFELNLLVETKALD